MIIKDLKFKFKIYFELLRWNKPTGRMILLIPAGWSLYLTPESNPSFYMLLKIMIGGLLVSGLGCVANDIWDKKIDQKVLRTRNRPLAANKISPKLAYLILTFLMLLKAGPWQRLKTAPDPKTPKFILIKILISNYYSYC